MHAFLSGFSLGFSLILAIGAQNAFVLKHGIRKEHVFVICFVCALSDAILIFAGVSGFGYLVGQFPSLPTFGIYGHATIFTCRLYPQRRHHQTPAQLQSHRILGQKIQRSQISTHYARTSFRVSKTLNFFTCKGFHARISLRF